MTKQSITNISCVLIVKDAQSTITKVLDSLHLFDDVVLYSNNSTDKTDEIARTYPNVTLINGEFLGFGATKNKAASYAKNDWILSLDADEVLSEVFIKNIKTLDLKTTTVYSILRANYYKTIQIKHCWGNDIIIRLYNKEVTSFTNKKVHESIQSENLLIQRIDGLVEHYPYATIADFIVKVERYSTIFAEDNVGKKNSSPTKALFNALYSFIKTYFFKRGFLDGYIGLIISFSHMATNFYKYIKLYELNQELDSK